MLKKVKNTLISNVKFVELIKYNKIGTLFVKVFDLKNKILIINRVFIFFGKQKHTKFDRKTTNFD